MEPVTHTRRMDGITPCADRPMRVVARDLQAMEILSEHSHPWGQLTYAVDGVIRVTAGNSTWIVPPQRAIWVPPLLIHEVATLEPARLRALYLLAEVAPFPGEQCRVLEVSALLREAVVALSRAEAGSARERLLAGLILDELPRLPTLPIALPLPTDKRLKTLCERLLGDPASNETLEGCAAHVGASARTLARLFERELGMSFVQWRQQMRLAHAAPLIARGMPLSAVAAELGYASQSAFSAMFKKTFGQSPSLFFRREG